VTVGRPQADIVFAEGHPTELAVSLFRLLRELHLAAKEVDEVVIHAPEEPGVKENL